MRANDLDATFKALASPIRRAILDLVLAEPGSNVGDICRQFELSRIAVLRHVNVLEEAGLLVSEREWRERRLYFNAVPIQMIYDRWTSKYSALWARDLAHLKFEVENKEELE